MRLLEFVSKTVAFNPFTRGGHGRSVLFWSFACSALLGQPVWAAGAKRVIFVADDKTMSWGEGYYRQNPMPKDQFIREADGQNFTNAWKELSAGDTLVILAHGTRGGGGITLGGRGRDGFKRSGETGGGTGAGCGTPYEMQKLSLENLTIDVKSCWGDADPDGEEAATSVAESLRRLNNTTGVYTVTGSPRAVEIGFRVSYKPNPPPASQKTATLNCLWNAATAAGFNGPGRIKAWFQSMKYPDQQTTIDAVLQACRNAGDDIVDGYNFTYLEPVPAPASSGLIVNVASLTEGVVVAGVPIEEPDIMTETPCDATCPAVAGECNIFLPSGDFAECAHQVTLAECEQLGGAWTEGSCVPAVSQWGLCVFTLLMFSAASVIIMRRQGVTA